MDTTVEQCGSYQHSKAKKQSTPASLIEKTHKVSTLSVHTVILTSKDTNHMHHTEADM